MRWSQASLCGFVERTVEAGAIVHTDGWQAYKSLAKRGYDHRPRSQRKAKREGDKDPVMPRAHRARSNLKAWVHGTHRWFSNEHTQVYLYEFTFHYNRRRTPMAAFQTLLGLASAYEPTNCADIVIAKQDSVPEREDLSGYPLDGLCRYLSYADIFLSLLVRASRRGGLSA